MQNHRLDRQAIGTALCALAGVALLRWYAIEDGFWSLRWLLQGFPAGSPTAPALFLWLRGANLWLLQVGLIALCALVIAWRRPTAETLGRALTVLGVAGIAYLLTQGFLLACAAGR